MATQTIPRLKVSTPFKRARGCQRPISPKMHGVADYAPGSMMSLAPGTLGFKSGRAGLTARVQGITSTGYSAFTRYELGLIPKIPMKTHLLLDAISGVFLAAAPWLFGFGKRRKPRTWLPHTLVAATEMTIVALTEPRSTR